MIMDPVTRSLRLHNEIGQIRKLTDFVESVAEELQMEPGLAFGMNLALEEAVTNVILYAYNKGTNGYVDIDVIQYDDTVEFILSDSGKPFDPTAVPDADVTLKAEDRQIGGLGIFLVRQIMDDVRYEYKNGRNILSMTKKYK